jgi:hypothetical protein
MRSEGGAVAITDVEKQPLVWPKQKSRTRIQDQKHNGAWKKPWREYMGMLDKELKRMGATRYVVTFNDLTQSRDPGVAVWFDRQKSDDYKWQDVLGIENPYPTVAEIDSAYKRIIQTRDLHPDRHTNDPSFDVTPYLNLTTARTQALAFVRGTTELPKGYVIPSDQWKEARQNLYAIIGTIQSIRRIERLGATQLFEGVLQGFAGVLPEKASEAIHV